LRLLHRKDKAEAKELALRPFFAKLSFIGSIGAVITFALTVSFLFSTPGALQLSHGSPWEMPVNSSSRIWFSLAHRSGLPRKHGEKISRSKSRLLN
jgi:amino acid transporter